ncbi:hypothetical protein HZP25_15840, partial [Elizabethkingia anophelis]|nr:hypothetical protein [Elizabethkingia anophelis]
WSKNTNNEPLDEKYIGETTAIHEAMKLYAREVAQASLEKAAEAAKTKKVLGVTKRFYGSALVSRTIVDKESITNESNITLL